MSPQKSRILADNVHDIRCDDGLVVFALQKKEGKADINNVNKFQIKISNGV